MTNDPNRRRRSQWGSDTRANLPRVPAEPPNGFGDERTPTPVDGRITLTIDQEITAPIPDDATPDERAWMERRRQDIEGLRKRAHLLSDSLQERIAIDFDHAERIARLEEDRADFDSNREFREWSVKRITHATGKDGDNGALGELRKDVDQIKKGRAGRIAGFVAIVLGSGTVVAWAASTAERLTVQVEHLKDEVLRLRAFHETPGAP